MYLKDNIAGVLKIRRRAKFSGDGASWHTWTASDTLAGLAWKLYGNAQLWWAIMDANPQYQHESEIEPGDALMLPGIQEAEAAQGG
jgi:nucleoid-associated protein YgaU